MASHGVRSLQARQPFSDALCPTSERCAGDQDDRFRLLRHHTKNALQRILGLIEESPELHGTPGTHKLSEALQRRVLLSARISDALFGLTREPGLLDRRLRSLCQGVVELLSDPDAEITFDVAVEGACPASLHDLMVRLTHEFVSNAIKHGFHARLCGHIDVRVKTDETCTLLMVSDDGWGFTQINAAGGEGLSIACALADEFRGQVKLQREHGRTLAWASVSDSSPRSRSYESLLRKPICIEGFS